MMRNPENTMTRPGLRRTGWIFVLALALAIAGAFALPQTVSAASVKPDQVTVIKATTDYDSITLEWKASKGATEYIVYRAKSKYGLYKNIKTVSSTRFKDRNLETGIAQWYKIRAVNDSKRSRKSPRISAVPMLKTPGLTSEAAGEGIYLKIDPVAGADGYVIYRDGKALSNQKDKAYLDNKVYADKKHRYKVVAYRHIGKKVIPSEFSRELTAVRPNLSISVSGAKQIPEIHEGDTYELTGKIKSNTTIKKVIVGIEDSENHKWIKDQKFENTSLNKMEFSLADVNEKIDFSKLKQGTYIYKVNVQLKTGNEKTILSQDFEIIQPPGAKLIVDKALELAWPKGTSSSKYSYPGGSRTDAYTQALSQAYGSRSGWSSQTAAGASCDVFVGAVIRASGYDTEFPRGLDGIEDHCASHKDKWELTGITDEKYMQPGDILFQIYSGGGGHVAVYLGDGLVANAHYHGKSYGVVQDMHNGGGISRHSWKRFKVYRPIQ